VPETAYHKLHRAVKDQFFLDRSRQLGLAPAICGTAILNRRGKIQIH
jgi:hypothetical protein